MNQSPLQRPYDAPPGYFGSKPLGAARPSWGGYPPSYLVSTSGQPAGNVDLYSDKSKILAGLLQIFVGFGVGRFYTGHVGLGIAQLLVVLFVGIGGVFCTLGFSMLVTLWTFIDGIIILTTASRDAHGRLLR